MYDRHLQDTHQYLTTDSLITPVIYYTVFSTEYQGNYAEFISLVADKLFLIIGGIVICVK